MHLIRHRRFAFALQAPLFLLAVQMVCAQIPSFSGAEGFGGTFSGSAPAGGWFSNASVYHVTTTADTLDGKTVNNIYVAGQTAPSPVTVYGNTTQITKSNNTMTSNVILRYMTFRKG